MKFSDEQVAAALTVRCGLCGVPPGEQCHSITSTPLNRPIHLYRMEPK
jgi:hypothetical protein